LPKGIITPFTPLPPVGRMNWIDTAREPYRPEPPAALQRPNRNSHKLVAKMNEPDFSKNNGLLPAIAVDATTGDVLMLAYMNKEAYEETRRTSRAVYFSRSRGKLWRKGEESGHVQQVREIYLDCDADTILLKVDQTGAACHQGYKTCFFRRITADGVEIDTQPLKDPKTIYPNKEKS